MRWLRAAGWVVLGVCAAASVAYATTQRRIKGIITAVDQTNVSISPVHGQGPCVTGHIDPVRTRIIVDGHPGRPADLHVTETARAELSLDEVWMTIRVENR